MITGATIVDVHRTARTKLATGIQRVVRKTIQRWAVRQDVVLAGWHSDYSGLRPLLAPEIENALHGTSPHSRRPRKRVFLVPWRSVYILPELAIESDRTARIGALAQFSGNGTRVIGYDCVPLTSAETTGAGMGAAFARNLTAVAWFDRIATISVAAAVEYGGWDRMLVGAGLTGPEVREVMLPIVAEGSESEITEASRTALLEGDLPLLLCVGSHEPRKNHLAVLSAADRLWREGRRFSLVFIGGNAWDSLAFEHEVDRLRAEGRPVRTISAVTDELLWSAYRLAACTVFPSLNEGYGLPVAESISVGTPVVTSGFGSMREIAETGGALLIDPRDEPGVAEAIDQAMFDPRWPPAPARGGRDTGAPHVGRLRRRALGLLPAGGGAIALAQPVTMPLNRKPSGAPISTR